MTHPVCLRDFVEDDLNHFFAHQLDADANWMAAFTAKDPTNRAAFDAHWRQVLADDRIVVKTILYGDEVAGHVLVHPWFGEPEVGYWLGKAYWGRGIATAALSAFLGEVAIRPLYARVAQDNIASRRVLEKCGFIVSGEDWGFSYVRGEKVKEFVLITNLYTASWPA